MDCEEATKAMAHYHPYLCLAKPDEEDDAPHLGHEGKIGRLKHTQGVRGDTVHPVGIRDNVHP